MAEYRLYFYLLEQVTGELIKNSEDPKMNPFLGTRVPGDPMLSSLQNLKKKCNHNQRKLLKK